MRKLMWFAIGFALAAVIGMYFLWGNLYFPASGVAAVLLAIFLYLMQRHQKLRIGVGILLGCVVGFVWMSIFDGFYLSVPRAADSLRENMTIVATDYSEKTDYGTSVNGIAKLNEKDYRIRVYLPENMEILPGDQMTGVFSLRATLPGCSNDSTYYAADHIFLTATIHVEPTVEKAEKLPWYGYPAYVRQTIKRTLNEHISADAAGFAVALLIGDKEGIDYQTDTAFKVSGISHIIAVSGLHVTILFSLVYVMTGRKKLFAMTVGIPVLFFFAAVAGFSPSITRACIMHSLMITAMLLNKEYDPPTALGFAVLVMLLANPWTVTSVSFQLSVACMVGIFLFAEPIKSWLMDRKRLGRWKGKRGKVANAFASSVGMSLGASILVTPLCAYYFRMVSLVGTITNLLTLWVISFVFYGIMAVCLLGAISSPLAGVAGWMIAWPIRYVLYTAKVMAYYPLAAIYMNHAYMVLWLIFVYILLVIHLLLKRKQVMVMCCCAIVSLCLTLTISWAEPQMDECRVTVLDVGQGQCILLQSQGKTFVVDCGGDSDTRAADTAANALLSQGVFKIDGLILTHYDRDHAAGAQYLLSRVSAQMLYLPNCLVEDGTSSTLSGNYSTLPVSEVMTIIFGKAKITLLPSKNQLSDNESGLCVLFQTENCDILITGDRSADGELELMEQIDLPKLEVLIVGHHGSKYSTCQELLDKTRPEIAIISVGQDNAYGHPTQEVLQRLKKSGCMIYRTDLNGQVVYRG